MQTHQVMYRLVYLFMAIHFDLFNLISFEISTSFFQYNANSTKPRELIRFIVNLSRAKIKRLIADSMAKKNDRQNETFYQRHAYRILATDCILI